MIKLLNSAMMPKEGIYVLHRIDKQAFCRILTEAAAQNQLQSCIGYPDNIETIKRWTGVTVELSRATTTVNDGDTLLIMKLKYRLADSSTKGKYKPHDDDFEFFVCEYRSHINEQEGDNNDKF